MVRLIGLVGIFVGVFFRSIAHFQSIVGGQYPRRGLNPHWTGFKPAASAKLGSGGPTLLPAKRRQAYDPLIAPGRATSSTRRNICPSCVRDFPPPPPSQTPTNPP